MLDEFTSSRTDINCYNTASSSKTFLWVEFLKIWTCFNYFLLLDFYEQKYFLPMYHTPPLQKQILSPNNLENRLRSAIRAKTWSSISTTILTVTLNYTKKLFERWSISRCWKESSFLLIIKTIWRLYYSIETQMINLNHKIFLNK